MYLVQFDPFDHEVARFRLVLDIEAGDDTFELDLAACYGATDTEGVAASVGGGRCRVFRDLHRVDRRHDERASQLAGDSQQVGFHFEELGFGAGVQLELVEFVLADGVGHEIDLFLTQAAELDMGDLVCSVGCQGIAAYLEFFGKDGLCGVVRGFRVLVEDVDGKAVEGRFGYRGRELVAVGSRQGDTSFGKIFQGKTKGCLARFRLLAASAALASDFIICTGSEQQSDQYE